MTFLLVIFSLTMNFFQRTACKTHAKKRHNIEITMYTRNPEVAKKLSFSDKDCIKSPSSLFVNVALSRSFAKS